MENIIIITTVHKWNDDRIYEKEVKSLSKSYNVFYIAPSSFVEKKIDNIKIIGLPIYKSRFKRLSNIWRGVKLCFKIKAKTVHFHDPELIILGIIVKLFSNKLVIYDVHEDYTKAILSKYWISKGIRNFISKVFNIIEKFAAKMIFDKIIVTTEIIKNQFPSEKTLIINNYPIIVYHEKPQKNNHELNLIVTGLMERIRGIFIVVEAMNYLKDYDNIQITLLGQFENISFKGELIDFIQKNNLSKQVCLKDSIPYQEMYSFLGKMDIGIVPYLPEPNHLVTLPNKMFEYMEAGLSILASDFPLYRKAIEEAGCGYVYNPLDPKELAEKILFLYQKRDLLLEFQDKAFKAFQGKFNWGLEEKSLLNLYENLF